EQEGRRVIDGGDHAADAAGVGAALPLGVHAPFPDLLHVVVAQDPGDRPEDEAEAVGHDGEDAEDEDQRAAVLGVTAATAAAAAGGLRLIVIVVRVIPGRAAARRGDRLFLLDGGGGRRLAAGRRPRFFLLFLRRGAVDLEVGAAARTLDALPLEFV